MVENAVGSPHDSNFHDLPRIPRGLGMAWTLARLSLSVLQDCHIPKHQKSQIKYQKMRYIFCTGLHTQSSGLNFEQIELATRGKQHKKYETSSYHGIVLKYEVLPLRLPDVDTCSQSLPFTRKYRDIGWKIDGVSLACRVLACQVYPFPFIYE